jgi:hypothetical protein
MTQDEIIELARQAGFVEKDAMFRPAYIANIEDIKGFAKLVAEREREEIAQFIERTNLGLLPEETALHYANLLRSYSTAIRARGQA